MSMLCNSQPWYGRAYLRSFDADPVLSESSDCRVTFRQAIPEEAAVESVTLAFQADTLTFVFERQTKPEFRKEWVLHRVVV